MTGMGQQYVLRRTAGEGSIAPKADRGRSTPRRRKLSIWQADDPLLCLQFAIVIAPGNLRPCRSQTYVPVVGLLVRDRAWMVCIRRKTSHRERGSGR
jgi:hypothetical protein